MRIVLLCFLFAGGLGLTCGAAHADNALTTARAGVLDLREWNWASDGPVALNGSWEFYWNWLGDPGGAPTPPLYVSVPGLWTEADRGENDPWPQHGFGSYRLRILLPPNSGDTYARRLALRFPGVGVNYELEVDGRLIARRGVVSANPALARNELYPAFVEIDREDFGGQLDLVLRTSNYYHGWASGPGAPLVFGPARLLSEERENAARLDVFLFGAILIMGLYHIALFAVRPRDVSPLYFGGFCLAVTLRLLVTGERILPAALADVFPVGAAFSFFTRVEYLSVYAAAPLFLLFARTLFPAYFASYLVRAIAAICLGLGLTTIVATPLWFATYTMPPFQGLLLLGGLMIFVAVGRAALHGREGSALFLIGFSLLFLSVLHDILGSRKFIHSEFLLPAGLFGFILAQAAMLAIRFAGAFRHVEDLTGELAARNKDLETAIDGKARQARSFERFVPGAFLEMLNRSSVMDVAAGDASLRDMSVMFCDIRSFTTLSEGLGPERSFEFLNQYLGRMVPVIEAHSGFVDKFHGDAIMALFRDGVDAPREAEENRGRELSSGDRALGAALEMFSKLRRFNREREILGVAPIRIGVGINKGEMMLGTVGSENRLDTTVIGNTVNMASRLESLTAFYGCSILISDFTRKTLETHEDTLMREVGAILLKGRKEPTGVYEVYAEDPPEEIERKERTKSELFMGIVEFKNREFRRACELFEEVLTIDPADRIAWVYIQRCEELLAAPPEENWQGVFEMYVK